MREQSKLFVFALCIIFSLLTITSMDYMTTGSPMFNEYPCGMSFNWLQKWWTLTFILFVSFGCIVACSYMMFREETVRHKLTAFLLALTIVWQGLSGNLDLLWFGIDKLVNGELWLQWDTVWVWSPFYWLFNIDWTVKHELIASFFMNLTLFGIWILYFKHLQTQNNNN